MCPKPVIVVIRWTLLCQQVQCAWSLHYVKDVRAGCASGRQPQHHVTQQPCDEEGDTSFTRLATVVTPFATAIPALQNRRLASHTLILTGLRKRLWATALSFSLAYPSCRVKMTAGSAKLLFCSCLDSRSHRISFGKKHIFFLRSDKHKTFLLVLGPKAWHYFNVRLCKRENHIHWAYRRVADDLRLGHVAAPNRHPTPSLVYPAPFASAHQNFSFHLLISLSRLRPIPRAFKERTLNRHVRIGVINVFFRLFLSGQTKSEAIKNVSRSSWPESKASSFHCIQGSSSKDQPVPGGATAGNHLCPHQNLFFLLASHVGKADPQDSGPLQLDRGCVCKSHHNLVLRPLF